MWMHPYVHEKLRELDAELAQRRAPLPLRHPASPPTRVTPRPLVRGTGAMLRRLGERLESWATPEAVEPDRQVLPERQR